MKVRAIAVATERSNAVGTVELECTPHGLSVSYLGVGSFSSGYAPAAMTSGTQVAVPWASVRHARVEGDQLYLEVDESLTPHHKLSLTSFSTGDAVDRKELRRQRWLVRIGAASAAAIAVIVTGLSVPRLAPEAGAAVAIGLATLSAAAILVIGLLADRWIAFGGVEAESTREAFVMELSRYLPTVGRLKTAAGPPANPLPSFQSLLPRTTTAIAITLTATVLGAVLTAKWVLSETDPEPTAAVAEPVEPEPERRAPAVAPAETATVAATPAPPPEPVSVPAQAPAEPTQAASNPAAVGAACTCLRSDSALWADPIPKLSLILLKKRTARRGRHQRTEIDVAAINNGDRAIHELSIPVEFLERDPPPSNKEYAVSHRSVYFKGPLEPGQAIKWTVEARGVDVRFENPVDGTIGPKGDAAAPTNFLAELLDANHRPVRLHGAMLLAYLGDPRARESALKLRDALRQDEGPYLDRLLRALAPVRVCGLDVTTAGSTRTVKACVHNTSAEPKEGIGVRLRALEGSVSHADPVGAPPALLAEATYELPGRLEPKRGVTISARFEVGAVAPRMFEAFADRSDLLP